MEKILEGSLACFEIPDLLTFLNMGNRTGVLVMEHPDQETKIFFKPDAPKADAPRTHIAVVLPCFG